ncbi:MAG TPA: CsbD family protein [Rhodothermales bacterium]|nr:CsbD family protein [Rhodothermales bacterium]
MTPREQEGKGNWKQFKGRLQESWGDLTNDDLDRYEGQREQLEGHIHEKTGETRESVRQTVDRIARDIKYNL